MSYLIDKRVLYKQTAEWEAQALAMVEKTMHDEDPTEWRKWSAVLTERTAFKHDVADAPTVEAIPIEYIQHWIDKKNYGRRNGKMMLAKALNELIAEWRTEHETE